MDIDLTSFDEVYANISIRIIFYFSKLIDQSLSGSF